MRSPSFHTRTPAIWSACGLLSAGLIAAGLTACSGSGQSMPLDSAAPSGPAVIVTTPILGSVASGIVACAGQGRVEVLMPNGSDPHDFTPSSAQVASLVNADLVIANGLGLESGMSVALEGAQEDGARIWEVGPLLDPLSLPGPSDEPTHEGEDAHAHEGEDAHAHEGLDPHFWFDMGRMARAATLMGEQLQQANGDLGEFSRCGQLVAAEIQQAETGVRALLESIPVERRILVTDHEALGYLAEAYGFQIAGAVVPAVSTLAEPSSAELADLAGVIRAKGVPAIFANVSQPAQLAQAVAEEAGIAVTVVPLYVESLGEPSSPAADYTGMMAENARLISSALAP